MIHCFQLLIVKHVPLRCRGGVNIHFRMDKLWIICLLLSQAVPSLVITIKNNFSGVMKVNLDLSRVRIFK